MCIVTKNKPSPIDQIMEPKNGENKNGLLIGCSNLLELAAEDDLVAFIDQVEKNGLDIDQASSWYGRKFGSKKMGFERRTPLMIAALYGSVEILKYVVESKRVDVNRPSESDGATALHCAAAGGSQLSVESVRLLLDASADVNCVDLSGNKPGDLIARHVKKQKALELLLKGFVSEEEGSDDSEGEKEKGGAKKEYPVDVSLPDINNGIYGTDEFRMYSFKVKPCSRAYSHDWTECPFVHPSENARRRDPRKYHYSCVPCPEFRKGSCVKGDACEYAHGVFESWLHPAQYRTRLCKDETGCARKVCFFAHKVEELRPLYASTGSAMPSPKSGSVNSMDMGSMTPPLSPSVTCSSPMGGNLWQSKVTPPTLQLPGSRLKTAFSARDLDLGLDLELLGLEAIRTQQQQQQQQRQQLIDDLSSLSSPWKNDYSNNRFGDMKPTNLDDVFGSMDPSMLSKLQGLSPKYSGSMDPSMLSQFQGLSPKYSTAMSATSQLQSPTGLQMRQNSSPLRSTYPSSNYSSSPVRKPVPTSYGFDSSAAVAQAVMNSRSAAFAKQRSQSFIDRGAARSPRAGLAMPQSPNLSEWGSPDGKLDWGFSGDEMNKLKKSASFGFRNGNGATRASSPANEPDVSWVNTMVKDVSSVGAGLYSSEQQKFGYGEAQEAMPQWVEQLYIEQEQMVA